MWADCRRNHDEVNGGRMRVGCGCGRGAGRLGADSGGSRMRLGHGVHVGEAPGEKGFAKRLFGMKGRKQVCVFVFCDI